MAINPQVNPATGQVRIPIVTTQFVMGPPKLLVDPQVGLEMLQLLNSAAKDLGKNWEGLVGKGPKPFEMGNLAKEVGVKIDKKAVAKYTKSSLPKNANAAMKAIAKEVGVKLPPAT